ncbi:UNVERIFIED_ORG: septum formation topological specificity factor MinE [Pseudomonas fluorescens]
MIEESENLKTVIRQLNFKKLKPFLESTPATEEAFMRIANLTYYADTIVRRRPGDDGKKRDKFLVDLGKYYKDRGLDIAPDFLNKIRTELLKIDHGYVEIHSVVPQMDSAKLSAEERISAVFSALDIAIRKTLEDIDRNADASAGVMGPERNLKDDQGTEYNPGAMIHGLTIAGGDVLMLEAYVGSWFDEENRITVPDLAPATESMTEAVGANLANAHTWRLWKNIDERVRHLGGSLEEYSQDLPEWAAGLKSHYPDIKTLFEFKPEIGYEQFDVLANERFDTIVQQNVFKLFRETNVVQKVAKSRNKVPLPPNGLVSVDEAFSAISLSHFTKIDTLKGSAGGLLLSERLRGYAVLRLLIVELEKEQGTYFPKVSYERLLAELERCGLTADVAKIFIEKTLFNKTSKDLYDHPIIKTTNGDYYIFGCSVIFADLTKTMFSVLAHENAAFEEKGKAFEQSTIRLLKQNRLNARPLRVKRGENNEHEFDYDVAFTWGENVFFIECKNRSIPMGNPILVNQFNEEMHEHVKQVQRLRQGLIDYPDILTKDFPEAVGKKPVFCILNALPYSMGEYEGIYVIDDSILNRFFSGPTFGVTMGRLDGRGPQLRNNLKRIWASSSPTVADFIKYIASPPQIKIAIEHYEIIGELQRISLKASAVIYDFRRKDLNSEALSGLIKKSD